MNNMEIKNFVNRIATEVMNNEIRTAIGALKELSKNRTIKYLDIDVVVDGATEYHRIATTDKSDDQLVEELAKHHTRMLNIYHICAWLEDDETRIDIGKANGGWFQVDPSKLNLDITQYRELAKTYLAEGWVPEEYAKELKTFIEQDVEEFTTRMMLVLFDGDLSVNMWTNVYYLDDNETARKLAEFFIVLSN